MAAISGPITHLKEKTHILLLMQFNRWFLCLSFSLLGSMVFGSHIVGGDLYYEYKGGDSFIISLDVYIDCYNGRPSSIASDTVAHFGIYARTDSSLYRSFTLSRISQTRIRKLNYNCLDTPTNVCVERFSYQTTIALPDAPDGYLVTYQRCCRNNTILNLDLFNGVGATYFVVIPERKTLGDNSSPKFKALPPNFLCINKPFSFSHSAIDKDGDSLVYELCAPYQGASRANGQPNPPPGPPYFNVNYEAGYWFGNQLPGSPALKINAKTGLLTCTPTRLGQYVVGICVKEYRNGQLLGTVLRDFQFNVINCDFDVVSAFAMPDQACSFKVDFDNESNGALSYKWDFGDPSTIADTSVQVTESYTYPKSGWYTVRLIAYSQDCSDTFSKEIYVRPDTPGFGGPDARSCSGEGVTIGPTTFFPNASYQWIPSTYLDSDTARNPVSSPPGNFAYILKQTFDYCYGYDTVFVSVGPPDIRFKAFPLIQCKNMTYAFVNEGEGTEFLWDFGTGNSQDRSTREHPNFTFPKEGTYTVKLVAEINPQCRDSVSQTIVVEEDTTSFAGRDRVICAGDSVYLGALPVYLMSYSWTPAATLDYPNSAFPLAKPTETTTYRVERSNGRCTVDDEVTITVDKPEPFFQLAYTFPCDGLHVKVYDASENVVDHKWDFGVEGSSTDTSTSSDSVAFTYPKSGNYSIRLEGTSAKGCSLTYEKVLNVLADTGLFAGPNTNICSGEQLWIGVNDTNSFARYEWSPKDSVSDFEIAYPLIRPTDTLTYVLRKKYPECTFIDSITVGVHSPLAGFSTNYDPHCDVFDIRLYNTSQRFDSMFWEVGDMRYSGGEDSLLATFSGTGSYTVQAVAAKEHCADTLLRTFKVYVDTGAFVIPDTVICLQDSIVLGAADTAINARYSWTPALYLDSDTIPNPKAYPKESTIYKVIRSFPGCEYVNEVYVRVAVPQASFDTTIRPDCYGFRAEFVNTSSGAEHYVWQFNEGESFVEGDDATVVFPYGHRAEAMLKAIDAHCADSFSMSAALLPFDSFEVIAPNIFSPNGDGYNDCFEIRIPKLPGTCKNFEILFFNRWGQQLFTIEQEGNISCWDGNNVSNKVPVSPGVYFYKVSVLDREVYGSVQVLR